MPSEQSGALLWAAFAWLPGGWREGVLLRVGGDGRWAEVTTDINLPPLGAEVLAGSVLPGLVNAHSHAFQRAFAGCAERRETGSDDFWSWRERMYAVALRVGPQQLRAIAAQLYLELLRGGYTHVCEFHYLQRECGGAEYADPLTMSWALADAAAEVGIGLTILPVLYERAGFQAPSLRDDQRRFRSTVESVVEGARRINATGRPLLDAGLAIHSMRGVSINSIDALLKHAEDFEGPIHIHVAEQMGEVDDCLRATGARPIEWLARGGRLDARWQLVHATHATHQEIASVAASGAGVVLCPSTEANLGDGLCDLPGWLAAEVPLTLGSDSHATRDWREELRLLEYGQRLLRRQRNVAAAPSLGLASTAERLTSRMLAGSAAAAGQAAWGLTVGARADLVVADASDAVLLGVPRCRTLDSLVFSSPSAPWRDVMVAGRWVLRDAATSVAATVGERFEAAMADLNRSTVAS